MTEAQEKKIRLKILKTIDEADQAKNPDGYATVMGGPQLDIRISQTTINQRGGGMSEYATIPKDIAQTVIPTDDGWPRSVFTITTTTEDQQSGGFAGLRSGIRPAELQADGYGSTV